jgi:hypothetical protein
MASAMELKEQGNAEMGKKSKKEKKREIFFFFFVLSVLLLLFGFALVKPIQSIERDVEMTFREFRLRCIGVALNDSTFSLFFLFFFRFLWSGGPVHTESPEGLRQCQGVIQPQFGVL